MTKEREREVGIPIRVSGGGDHEVIVRVVVGSPEPHEREAPPAAAALKLLVDVDEAAERLSLSRRGVYRLMESGELPYLTIASRRRIAVASLEQYIDARARRKMTDG